ncbi:hypothetical protein [Bradyrhizobium tunisiense]|uniref:hypothetical protein n=1 Tax=Bradyrhizobium tunisiense TaxID=3278709 RepID=UPI0035DB943D
MKALLDGDSLELSGMTGAFRQQLHSGLTPGAAFRAGGTGKRELAVMKAITRFPPVARASRTSCIT